jgi:hypothetical protein
VVVLLILLATSSPRPGVRSLCYAAACGIAFGISSALSQTLTLDFATGSLRVNAFITMAIGVLVVTAAMLAQASYRYGLAAPLATSTLTNPIAAAVVGVVVLGERLTVGAVGIPLALAAAGLAAYGVAVLTAHAADNSATPSVVERAPAQVTLVRRADGWQTRCVRRRGVPNRRGPDALATPQRPGDVAGSTAQPGDRARSRAARRFADRRR